MMKVTVEPYNEAWAVEFENEKAQLQTILTGIPVNRIEHVGSTAIPGLPAKPVLDIDIIIPQSSLSAARQALVKGSYIDCGEMDIPGRFVFRQPGFGKADAAHGRDSSGKMRRNTYLIIEGCPALRNHIDLKRVLLENSQLREEYGRVKLQLSNGEYTNIDEYVHGKNVVILKILRAAGWSEEDLEPVIKANS